MNNGCLEPPNPKTREVLAFYHVTVTDADNIPVQYETTYDYVVSVTYADNRGTSRTWPRIRDDRGVQCYIPE